MKPAVQADIHCHSGYIQFSTRVRFAMKGEDNSLMTFMVIVGGRMGAATMSSIKVDRITWRVVVVVMILGSIEGNRLSGGVVALYIRLSLGNGSSEK